MQGPLYTVNKVLRRHATMCETARIDYTRILILKVDSAAKQ